MKSAQEIIDGLAHLEALSELQTKRSEHMADAAQAAVGIAKQWIDAAGYSDPWEAEVLRRCARQLAEAMEPHIGAANAIKRPEEKP